MYKQARDFKLSGVNMLCFTFKIDGQEITPQFLTD